MKCEFFGCMNEEGVQEVTIGPGTNIKLCPTCTAAEFSMCDQGPENPPRPRGHMSDCAQHNMPAYPNESCDCDLEVENEEGCSRCEGSGFLLNSYGVACGPCPSGCKNGYLVAKDDSDI